MNANDAVKVNKSITFSCSKCGKVYETRGEAEHCFERCNTCECLKSDFSVIAGHHHHTDWSKDGDVDFFQVCLGFKEIQIFTRIISDFGQVKKYDRICEMKYCPFCGRTLNVACCKSGDKHEAK
jgi:hypothetical protein